MLDDQSMAYEHEAHEGRLAAASDGEQICETRPESSRPGRDHTVPRDGGAIAAKFYLHTGVGVDGVRSSTGSRYDQLGWKGTEDTIVTFVILNGYGTKDDPSHGAASPTRVCGRVPRTRTC
jgi:hypothetical protein